MREELVLHALAVLRHFSGWILKRWLKQTSAPLKSKCVSFPSSPFIRGLKPPVLWWPEGFDLNIFRLSFTVDTHSKNACTSLSKLQIYFPDVNATDSWQETRLYLKLSGCAGCVCISSECAVFEVCFLSQHQKNNASGPGVSLFPEGRTRRKPRPINLRETGIKAAVSERSLGCWNGSGTFLPVRHWACLTASIPTGAIYTLPSY